MFNICPKCGEYSSDKIIDKTKNYAICPACGYAHKFERLPLFIVTGASGTGKSSICLELSKHFKKVIFMESDILWKPEFNLPNKTKEYREMWLRVCKNISQGGKPVVLCGSVKPEELEECIERRYFSNIHYLALVCEDSVISKRLYKRAIWRKPLSDKFINTQVAYNQWFKNKAPYTNPAMETLNTSNISLQETLLKVEQWVEEKLSLE